MPQFPPSPVSPSEFMEDFLPKAFAESEALKASVKDLEARLGIKLEGEGGGEWVVHVAKGDVRVEREPRDEAAFTFVQSVGDWRGALWEGRGGAIGRQASALFRPGQRTAASGPGGMGASPTPAALAQMQTLSGLIGLFLYGAALGALGCFASVLTRSQIVAGVVAIIVGLMLYLLEFFAQLAPEGSTREFVHWVAIGPHFEPALRGEVRSEDLVYYGILIAFFLLLVRMAVESFRWR